MSSLNVIEKKSLESLFQMGGGYVLDFTDRSFDEFVRDVVNLEIHSDRYTANGTSKANKLRTLWRLEPDALVHKLLDALIDYATLPENCPSQEALGLEKRCRQIAVRLGGVEAEPVDPHAPAVFISYRRDDASAEAALVRDAILSAIGAGSVFMDVSSISPGAQWALDIEQSLQDASTVVVIIGPSWLQPGEWGLRRIDEESDWVRREIENSLASGQHVLPVLVNGGRLPPPEALPHPIRSLLDRQAIEIRRDYRDHDLKLVTDSLKGQANRIRAGDRKIDSPDVAPNKVPMLGKRERDLETLRKVFYWINLEQLDIYLDRLGAYARCTNAGIMMGERLQIDISSLSFYISDSKLDALVRDFSAAWANSLKYAGGMVPGKRESHFYMPGDFFQSKEQEKHASYTMAQAAPMRSSLTQLLNYVREYYEEIDLKVAGIEGLKDYEAYETRMQDALNGRLSS